MTDGATGAACRPAAHVDRAQANTTAIGAAPALVDRGLAGLAPDERPASVGGAGRAARPKGASQNGLD